MSKKSPHAATPALKVVEDAGIDHHVYTFEAGKDHFGDHAGAALEVEPERVLKTLVIDLTAGKGPKRQLAVCVIPTTHHLSLKKAAAAHGVSKAAMADPHDASKSSGYIPGGISPLGQKTRCPRSSRKPPCFSIPSLFPADAAGWISSSMRRTSQSCALLALPIYSPSSSG